MDANIGHKKPLFHKEAFFKFSIGISFFLR